MDNKFYLLALNRMPGIGSRTMVKLIQRWPVLDDFFQLSVQEKIHAGCSRRVAEILSAINVSCVDQDFEWEAAQANRKLITWVDSDDTYPYLLKQIHDPPPVLYAEGDFQAFLQPTLAIVGTRKPSVSGGEIAWQFAYEIAKAEVTIVSGLARGIDARAHEGSIAASGKTIAVMGTGIDCIYPRQHAKLAKQIVENGLILSEFPLKCPPVAGHFPRRNRIISGLSLATLVVESAVRSGSLLTARLALEQDRDVLAIPGSIRNIQSAGCHYLLQQGAKLITSVADVLEDFSSEKYCKKNLKKQVLKTRYNDRNESNDNINKNDKSILDYLGDELISVDQLVVKIGWPVEDIICHLVELELDGLVQSLPGGYVRCML
jgi:DNA processing protein